MLWGSGFCRGSGNLSEPKRMVSCEALVLHKPVLADSGLHWHCGLCGSTPVGNKENKTHQIFVRKRSSKLPALR